MKSVLITVVLSICFLAVAAFGAPQTEEANKSNVEPAGQMDQRSSAKAKKTKTIYIPKDAGKFIRDWGKKGNANGQLNWPSAIAVGLDKSVYITDASNARVQKFSSAGKFINKWGSAGTGLTQFLGIRDIAVAPNGTLYVVDSINERIKQYSTGGIVLNTWGHFGHGAGQFDQPYGIAAAPDGSLFIADTQNHRIQHYSAGGAFLGQWTVPFKFPQHIAAGPDGSVYVSDPANNQVLHYDSKGKLLEKWGKFGLGDGEFGTQVGIAVADDGAVYVGDSQRDRIQVFTSDGTFITKWGTEGDGKGQFQLLAHLAVSPDGTIYASDNYQFRIQQFKSGSYVPQGKTVTISGKISGEGITAQALAKMKVRLDGKDPKQKRKFYAVISPDSGGNFTFTDFPQKRKYKIKLSGYDTSMYSASPKKLKGTASKNITNENFTLVKK